MKNNNLTIQSWAGYELLDSGNNRKLERYGKYILIRPETQAIWNPRKPELWRKANAEFVRHGEKGEWKGKIPEAWNLAWRDITFSVRPTAFKHTGVFPEQAANWEWISSRVKQLDAPNVLNLFGYTGIASVVAAKNGARVTHVDASKQSNAWAKENADLSGLPGDAIRFVLDDALKFVEREVRRGAGSHPEGGRVDIAKDFRAKNENLDEGVVNATPRRDSHFAAENTRESRAASLRMGPPYDGIILDPPAFGRGAKGEVWHIEEDLPRLLASLAKIFSNKPGSFFILNGYAAGYSPQSFLQATQDHFKSDNLEFGELRIPESNSPRLIPAGIYVRFVK